MKVTRTIARASEEAVVLPEFGVITSAARFDRGSMMRTNCGALGSREKLTTEIKYDIAIMFSRRSESNFLLVIPFSSDRRWVTL